MKRILILFILTAACACRKDLLDREPINAISNEVAYSTPAKLLAQVNALYQQLANAGYYGGRFIVFNEQRGEEFSQNDGNNSTGANVWNQSISASGDFVNAVWTAAYGTINNANLLLDNLASTTVVSDSLRRNYIAEARFVRAFAYFSLVQTYARPYRQNAQAPALPLRTKGETNGKEGNLAFSTVTEIYEQIEEDLNQAEADLPLVYASALLNVSRAHKASAIALKTRVYLVKGDYANVIAEASKLVPASAPYQYTGGTLVHRLEASVATLYSGTYTGPEAIFTIPFINPAEAPGLQAALANNYLTPVLYLNKDGIVANSVFGTGSVDARKALVSTNANNLQLLRKFPKNSAPYLDYIPLIRYAEVLLNYAEAAAEENDLDRARALLAAVRNRSDAGYVFITGTATREELINTILTERRIELVGEGFRTPDLLRLVQPLPAKVGNAGNAPRVEPAAANYVWPVPSNELAYNTLAPR